jgi:hypothetical protein
VHALLPPITMASRRLLFPAQRFIMRSDMVQDTGKDEMDGDHLKARRRPNAGMQAGTKREWVVTN